jgi:hypothetical protein
VEQALHLVEQGVALADISELPVLRRLQRMGEEVSEQDLDEFQTITHQLETELGRLEGTREHAG